MPKTKQKQNDENKVRIDEWDEVVAQWKQKKQKEIVQTMQSFFDDAFVEVAGNLECYEFSSLEGLSLYADLEMLMFSQLQKISPTATFPVKTSKNEKELKVEISAEPFFRTAMQQSLGKSFDKALKNADKNEVKNYVFADEILQKMTKLSCDNVIELAKNNLKQQEKLAPIADAKITQQKCTDVLFK